MSVSSVSGNSIWSSSPPSSATGASAASASELSPPSQGQQDRFDTALSDQGFTGTKLSDLRSQIDSAVKSAQSGGGDVKSAVDGVLQKNGVDLSKLQKDVGGAGGAHRGHGRHHKKAGGDGDDASGAAGASSTDSTTSPTSAASTLQSLLSGSGIDAGSFQASLTSILNGSKSDTSSLFSGAAVGSSLDVAA